MKKIQTKKQLLFRDAFLCLCMALLFIFAISYLVLNLSIFNPFTGAFKDFSFLDLYYSEKMASLKPSKDVVLVNVEHADRFQIQELMAHVQKQKPKVIGMDIIFKDKKDPFVDSLLQLQLNKPNVITAKAFVENSWDYDFSNTKRDIDKTGYTNLNFQSTDNVIRKFQGYKRIDDTLHTSLATTMVGLFKNGGWPSAKLQKKLEKEGTIDFIGNMDSFITFSLAECMEAEQIPAMQGKIVLLGYLGDPHGSPTDIEDKFFTPLNPVSAGKSVPDMFGSVIHANIIEMMLTDTYFYSVPKWILLMSSLILAYFGLAFFMWYNRKSPASYALIKKVTQLSLTVLLLWFSLWLYKHKINFAPELVIAFLVVSVEFIGLYVLISKKLNNKYQWKSFFFFE